MSEAEVAVLNRRTNEPRRPVVMWIAAACYALAVASLGTSLATVYWDSVIEFNWSSWLAVQVPTGLASLERVLLTVALTLVALLPSIACVIAGFYAWAGYRWARWAAIIAVVATGLARLLNVIALAAIPLALAGMILIWLPASQRFFAAWYLRRHPAPRYAPPVTEVYYGPLPRYR